MKKSNSLATLAILVLGAGSALAAGFDLTSSDFEPAKPKKIEKKKRPVKTQEQKKATTVAQQERPAVQRDMHPQGDATEAVQAPAAVAPADVPALDAAIEPKGALAVTEIDCATAQSAVDSLLAKVGIVFEKDAMLTAGAAAAGAEFSVRTDRSFNVNGKRFGLIYNKLDAYGLSIAKVLAGSSVTYTGILSTEPLAAAHEAAQIIGDASPALRLWSPDSPRLVGGVAGFYMPGSSNFVTCARTEKEIEAAGAAAKELAGAIDSARVAEEAVNRPKPVAVATPAEQSPKQQVDDGSLTVLRLGPARY